MKTSGPEFDEDSIADVFLWILRNFPEQLLDRMPPVPHTATRKENLYNELRNWLKLTKNVLYMIL